jgi:hypothetical protein
MKLPLLAVATLAILSACNRQPRSEEYFSAHLDEARQVVAECRRGSIRGEECGNADYAVKLARAQALRDHFFMKDR